MPQDSIPAWKEGELDIHTISTGRGNCQYFIFPDGTTMMIDAGDFDGNQYNEKYKPMRCSVIDTTKTAAQIIANYIKNIKGDFPHVIDYFLLTHFHTDHYGAVRQGLPFNKDGNYYLIGLTELAEYIPINIIVDRNYPTYDFPIQLKGRLTKKGNILDPSFENYLTFAEYAKNHKGIQWKEFELGKNQFILKHKPAKYNTFRIDNIKVNNLLWDSTSSRAKALFNTDELLGSNNKFSENPLSCAIVLKYGDFKFFAGGDNTGLVDQDHASHCDIETPMSKEIGKVTAMTLNHHGNRDATNLNFLTALDPEVVILQSWSSDHPGQDTAQRLISPNIGTNERRIYMTNFDSSTGIGIGPWFERKLTESNCHILMRIKPDGSYKIYTTELDNIIN